MTFIWPFMLFSLIFVPLIVLLYWRVQRQRRTLAASFARFDRSQSALKRHPGIRRHLPPILFLVSLVVLLVALARPQAEINLPRVEGTVMLVFDVSGSMAAEDAQPTRLEAAKVLAKAFVLSQPETVQVGIVSFSGTGFAVQTPTNDTQRLLVAINRLQPQTGTSLGQGILVALNAIAVDAGLEPPAQTTPQAPAGQGGAQATQQPGPSDNTLLAQLPEGPYPPAVIVLLSDGENNQGFDPVKAAEAAADRAVRVNALGFGTTAGTTLEVEGFKVHTALDEDALQQITQTAGGEYYNAQNEPDPQTLYANLTPQLVVKPEKMEITSVLTGVSILILSIGALLSMVWFNRLP